MKLKRPLKNKDERIEVRCTLEEKNAIKRKAALYDCDVSEWILYASLNFVPGKEDLEEEKSAPRRGRRKKS